MLVLAGVAGLTQAQETPQSGTANADQQSAFRVRADPGAGLNTDEGWAGGLNEAVDLQVEQPFRLRFELESSEAAAGNRWFGLQYRRNGGDWNPVPAADFPYAEATELTPRTSIISTSAYPDGAATSDLLSASGAPFRSGTGINYSALTPPLAGGGHQSEWEWPLVIRRYADGAVTNEDGDQFEFRMVDAEGRPVRADNHARVSVSVPPRLLGGTFVETPGRLGPWQASNGDLYFIMEPAESYNVLMMVKSTDGGQSWQEVDDVNRPVTGDLEGLGSAMLGDSIHILHQIDERVVYHSFRIPDGSDQPDGWQIRDEVVATPGEPPVQVATLEARSDGSLVAVYGGPDKIRLSIRSPQGEWGESRVIDADTQGLLSGPQTVLGSDDVVHLAYTDNNGDAWYRRLLPENELTPRQHLASDLGTSEADVGAVLPLVYLPESDSVVAIYRQDTGHLWQRRISGGEVVGEPVRVTERSVVQNAVDSDQVGADVVAYGGRLHLLFIEAGTGRIFHTHTDAAGNWQPASLQKEGLSAQWLRGQPLERADGTPVYGYVYDAGSNGGSGRNWYSELVLEKAGENN